MGTRCAPYAARVALTGSEIVAAPSTVSLQHFSGAIQGNQENSERKIQNGQRMDAGASSQETMTHGIVQTFC
jgi:hypothetical protein